MLVKALMFRQPANWLLSTILLSGSIGCGTSQQPDPKETLKRFFAAIRTSDTLFITQHVDFEHAAPTLNDEPSSGSVEPEAAPDILAQLTGEGQMRSRWLENQIVLGRSTLQGDTAWVEVSFIDRLTRVQYYNKMRLEFRNNDWVINSFRTL